MDFLEEELEEILNIFREESEEQIQSINQNLLKLEKKPDDFGVISELFREAHSIKGSARMIGLNDIQNLAHKLEDILGYAKERTLRITPEIIDVLCRTVDCIASIIDESVKTKGEFHSDKVDAILEEFENIGNFVSSNDSVTYSPSIKTKKEETKIDTSTSTKEIIKSVNLLMAELFDSFKAVSQNPSGKEVIGAFHELINQIDKILTPFDNRKIRDMVFNIRSKLDWIKKGSGILNEVEVSELWDNLHSFLDNIRSISSNLELESSGVEAQIVKISKEQHLTAKINDFKNAPSSNPTHPKEAQKEEPKDDIFGNKLFQGILHNIDKLNNKQNIEESCREIFDGLTSVSSDSENQNAKDILTKFTEVISYIKQMQITPDKEILSVLKQSINLVEQLVSSEQSDEDPALIIQRLSILQQMLELSGENFAESVQEYSPAVKSTEMILKEEQSDSVFVSSSSTVESNAIKTLRVDTKKLDQLVSQVGELIVAKIKTKEHLVAIEQVSRTIDDWSRSWNKSKQYYKNVDRKVAKDCDIRQSTPIQPREKNVYSVYEDPSERIAMLTTQVNSLYRMVQDDDARMNLIVNELEQMIKSVRVLPLATIFHMFPRMVRDISRDKGKQVELILSGSETSADKKVIEEIKSPLTHIIRNAIDHGIETPEERIKHDKNPTGKIFLSAYHLENSVLIEVIDDGRGIDTEKIKSKVLQKGLLTPEELETMTENQIMNIIFWPGFSTGDVVTDISGRGIGLDVVHTKISQLDGKVNIKSRPGEGCKVSIQLPVTMATIKSFLVEVNQQTFAIPTNAIKTATTVKPREIFFKEGRKSIIVGDKTLPVFKLSNILEMEDVDSEVEPDKYVIVVIQVEDMQVGFIIDKLIGDYEILHKNLTPPLIRVRNIAGVTTLGSGELCLILNINDLIKSSLRNTDVAQHQIVALKNEEEKEKFNILVVDDSMTTRILERNILRTAGYDVSVAVNGLEALTKLNAQKFHLMVSDIEMPEMTGIELVKRIRKDKTFKNLPVILVTSLAREQDKAMGLDAGANAFIPKGQFDQQELLNTIKKLLK